jgi:uncharacterized protein
MSGDVLQRLNDVLLQIGPLAVAVSGGVDSLTLAETAHRLLGADRALMVHAASPAVPLEATQRVYGTIRQVTDRTMVSGANLDDLGEYRPGLDAAREYGVRHPYVEAGLDKATVRALARDLGLGSVAELPAAPCLSSRVETGIRIEPEILAFIHAVEGLVSRSLQAGTGPRRAVRCRVRAAGIVVELDPDSLAALDSAGQAALSAEIRAGAPANLPEASVRFAAYRTGSAFLTGTVR